MDHLPHHLEKINLSEINSYLTCYLCKGYLIDATTILECLHSFCRSCIIKFLDDNSFCPVCEVIINKAKPNLKLDKTLQDIVYKLVPGLFLKEMITRKHFYAKHPEVESSKLSPEQRGEDTERTIFNPQDPISLSLEYMSDESMSKEFFTNGTKNNLKQRNATEERKRKSILERYLKSGEVHTESLLKRFLQCPGMCRIDVIKKFIQNKYNVNTEAFQIDILYKRAPLPLPDHYTLIDIAYIYMWKRNEPMKFYFRITDKAYDEISSETGSTPLRIPNLPTTARRRSSISTNNGRRVIKMDETKLEEIKTRFKRRTPRKTFIPILPKVPDKTASSGESKTKTEEIIEQLEEKDQKAKVKELCTLKLNGLPDPKKSESENKTAKSHSEKVQIDTKIEVTKPKSDNETLTKKESGSVCKSSVESDSESKTTCFENKINSKIDVKSAPIKKKVYTNITLNRTNNIEIITRIHKLANKEGEQIGVNIINQTIKKPNSQSSNNSNFKVPSCVTKKDDGALSKIEINETSSKLDKEKSRLEEEKFEFLKSIELTSKSVIIDLAKQQQKHLQEQIAQNKEPDLSHRDVISSLNKLVQTRIKTDTTKNRKSSAPPIVSTGIPQKRKNSSPLKCDAKKANIDKRSCTKIIIQPKSVGSINLKQTLPSNNDNVSTTSKAMEQSGVTYDPAHPWTASSELHSLFQNCKITIPSSLSITLKDNPESGRKPMSIPPVQNYIEILKIPDNSVKNKEIKKDCSVRSSTEEDKTISVPNFTPYSLQTPSDQTIKPVPVTSILPTPVPEVTPAVTTISVPKDNNALSRSVKSQSFQKIFEESILKNELGNDISSADTNTGTSNVPASHNNKRNILEIASQLYKKNKLEQENAQAPNTPLPKVAIPRLPNPRARNDNLLQTVSNLHSTTLGLNYSVSIGQNSPSSTSGDSFKFNGIVESPISSPGSLREAFQSHESLKNEPASLKSNTFSVKSGASQSSSPSGGTMTCKSPLRDYDKKSDSFNPNFKIIMPESSNFKTRSLASPLSDSEDTTPLTVDTNCLSPPLVSPKHPNVSSDNKLEISPKKSEASSKKHRRNSVASPKCNAVASPKCNTAVSSPKEAKEKFNTANTLVATNQLLEKYQIQNLAQLSASMNFNGTNPTLTNNNLVAFQQAMFLNHLHANRNWFNINAGPLLQYEKYLQSLSATKNQLLGNIKEN